MSSVVGGRRIFYTFEHENKYITDKKSTSVMLFACQDCAKHSAEFYKVN